MPDYSRYQLLQVEEANGVATVTLNRPESLNAFNEDLHTEVEDVFLDLAGDPAVKAIILTGAGRAFSAGGDIREMAQCAAEGRTIISLEAGRRIINNLLMIEVPIIAAINGDAMGLGATVALFCDIALAATTARIGDPHVRVGLVAGDGGAVIWPLLLSLHRAKYYLLTGDLIPALEAERMGLIFRAVPPDELMPAATELAQRLANGPPFALRGTKVAVNKLLRERTNLILDTSLGLEFLSMATEDHREATHAFIEKRVPHFKGR